MSRRYANLDPRHVPHGFREVFRWAVLDRLTGRRRVAPAGAPAPRVAPDLEAIHFDGGTPRATWIGHSSVLVTLASKAVLIDPVFSGRIARVIRRHGEAGLQAVDLPEIAAVLVSHNHYDHLDEPSIRRISRNVPVLAPAGLGRWFRRRGFTRVTEMEWWQRHEIGPVAITFVPARHWSRRVPWDTNRSWWGGYVLEGGGATVYHAGDSAWFDGFRLIAERFPSIDLALLPIGAYAPAWFMGQHHMNPEEALDALALLRPRSFVPIHWGAFQLTDEPLQEPIERLKRAWMERKPAARLHLLSVGETLDIAAERAEEYS